MSVESEVLAVADEVLLQKDTSGVATITLNRPHSLNGLDAAAHRLLLAHLREAEADEAIRVLQITGAGRAFCSGGDVSGMEGSHSALSFDQRVARLRERHESFAVLHGMAKPTIAVVNGVAAGIGLVLMAACDFRIASDAASFTTGFVRIGLSGDMGGSFLISRLIGADRAQWLYLSGERIDAHRASAMGLVSRVVPAEELVAEAAHVAGALATGASLAQRSIKQNFARLRELTFLEVQEMEAQAQIRLATTQDHQEAVAAFRAKRAPRFVGR